MTPGARLGFVGAFLLVSLGTVAAFGPLLVPYDPSAHVSAPFTPPGRTHLLGTDDVGQDLLSQLVVGARVSLLVGVAGAVLATTLGTLIGLTAGISRGVVDMVLMRAVDVVLTLPTLPVMIVLHAWLGAGLATQVIVIGGLMWARTARVLRAQALSSRERSAVAAAHIMGASRAHQIRVHVLPAALPLLVPEFVRAVNTAIVLETSLSFLGFGDPTARSWGMILYYANARNAYLTSAWPWWVVPPGAAVGVTVMAFAFVGYALEEAARPVMTGLRPGRAAGSGQPAVPAGGHAGPVAEAREVSIEYATPHGRMRVVEAVSLAVGPGEIVGIVGESGSGKTTLATALMQLGRPPGLVTGGELLVEGRDVTALSSGELRALRGAIVSLVPQQAMSALDPIRAVEDQILEAIQVHGRVPAAEARRRTHHLLEAVGIPLDRARAYPHELSGGMRQRAVVAMAMVHRPRLVIADEPTSGLDVLRQSEILALLGDLRARFRTAMLFISHDLGAVAAVADRLVVMRGGRIVETGRTPDVMTTPRDPCTRGLIAAMPPLHGPTGGAIASARPRGRSEEPLLVFEAVSKSFPSRRGAAAIPAVRNVSFTIAAGERVGLVGASGAGKSTIGRLIVGLERADCGRIVFAGRERRGDSVRERRWFGRRLHMIFQDPYDALPPSRRVSDIVGEPAAIHDARDLRTGDEALEAVGLTPAAAFRRRHPHQLSGGERQRVALARALVLQPQLIVADEPTSLLDLSLRTGLLDLMREAGQQHGTAYLYITHDLALARAFCHRLIILDDGALIEEGDAGAVIDHPRHPSTVALVRAAESRLTREP